MIAALLAVHLLWTQAPEPLPIDERMALIERALPGLRDRQAEIDAQLDKVGPVEQGWSTSGLTLEAALAAGDGMPETHALQRRDDDRPSVRLHGSQPLAMPPVYRRYGVRDYSGPIDTHVYYRLAPGIILHAFGSTRMVGTAACRQTQGLELLSARPWQSWSAEEAVQAFAMAQWSRDDPRTYCTVLTPVANAGVTESAFTPDGRRYAPDDLSPPTFQVVPRDIAARQLFAVQPGSE